MRLFLWMVVFVWGSALISGRCAEAQEIDSVDRVAELQRENTLLRKRNAELEDQLNHLQARPNPVSSVSGSAPTVQEAKPASVSTASEAMPAFKVSVPLQVTAPVSLWKHELAAGGSLNSGNSNAYALQLKEQSDRTTEIDKLHFGAVGDFKRLEGATITNRAEGSTQYDHQISGKFYGYAHGKVELDQILSLTYRLQIGPGLGYYIIKTNDISLALEAGPAIQLEKFHDLPDRYTAQAQAGDHFKWQISKTFHLFQDLQLSKDVSHANGLLMDYNLGIQSYLTEKLSFRITGNDRYNSTPTDGTKRNDTSVITSLGWDF